MSEQKQLMQLWQTLRQVPAGKVVSYGQLADLAGLPGRARLAGRALKLAPAELALPWHRVVCATGKIAFPAESEQWQTQIALLQQEGISVRGSRVNIAEYGWQPALADLLWRLNF